MGTVATAFWGAFFGAVSLSLVAALLAFTRSARRVALTGCMAAVLSALYVLVYLGWVPIDDGEVLMRVQALLAAVSASVLGLLLFRLLGLLREPATARQVTAAMAALGTVVLATGLFLSAEGGLLLAAGMAWLVIPAALGVSVRSARGGGRLGWIAVAGVVTMSVPVVGLTWSALQHHTPTWVHAVSATAATAYLAIMASAMWVRYSYLIDVREAMVLGPAFDPVTRMRTHAETGVMVGDAFSRLGSDGAAVLVVSIANLQALEQLHGRAAYNHALFLCAGRLRRCVPPGVEMGRLGDDAFLLLTRRSHRADGLHELAQEIARRMRRPVVLGTSHELAALEASRTQWVAEIGVGVFVAPPGMRPGVAVAGAKAMSRTAWSYVSRVAIYDGESRQITELPLDAGAAG